MHSVCEYTSYVNYRYSFKTATWCNTPVTLKQKTLVKNENILSKVSFTTDVDNNTKNKSCIVYFGYTYDVPRYNPLKGMKE